MEQERGGLKIAWVISPDNCEAQRLESELFDWYYADHIELPPLNRTESGQRIRRLMIRISTQEPERRNLFFMLMLAKAIEGQDPKRGVQKALRYYRGDQPQGLFRPDGPVSQGIHREPVRTILEMLNAGLKGTRPVVWWSYAKKKASLGLYCPDGHTALYALALEGMGSLGGLGVCQRCGNPFHRSRRTQHYCSHRCQLAASMRRFRLRHASRHKRRKPKKSRDTLRRLGR